VAHCKVYLGHSAPSSAKIAELIDMPFGLWARMGPRNPVLNVVPDPPWEWAVLRGEGTAHCKVQQLSAMSFAKMAEPIVMPFGIWTPISPRKHVGCTLLPPSKYH